MGGFNTIQDVDRYLQGGQKAKSPTPGLTPPPGKEPPAPSPPGPQFHNIADVDRFLTLNTQAQKANQNPPSQREKEGRLPWGVEGATKGVNYLLQKDEDIKNWSVQH